MEANITYAEKEQADKKVNLEGVIDLLKKRLVNLEAFHKQDEMTITDLKGEVIQLV